MQEVLSNKGKCFNVVITIFKSADANKRSPKQPCEAPHEWPHWEPVACILHVCFAFCMYPNQLGISESHKFHIGFKCSAAGFLVQFRLFLYFITLIFQWHRDCPLTLQGITPPDSELESILPIYPMAVRRPYAITVWSENTVYSDEHNRSSEVTVSDRNFTIKPTLQKIGTTILKIHVNRPKR